MRGTQRRVIYLKNTGSDMFDEAYFVIKENAPRTDMPAGENDLIKEADRIINEHIGRKSKKIKGNLLKDISILLTGFAIAFITAIIIF